MAVTADSSWRKLRTHTFLLAIIFGLIFVPCDAFVVCPGNKGHFPRLVASNTFSFSRTRFESNNYIHNSNIGRRVELSLHSSGIKDIPESEASHAELPNDVLEAVVKAAKSAVERSTGEGTESGGPGLPFSSLLDCMIFCEAD